MSGAVTVLTNHCRVIQSYIMGDPIPSITLLIGTILLSVVVTKAEQQGVKMKITVSTSRHNKTMETRYLDLNRHLTGTERIISSEVISRIRNNMKYTVLFERLNQMVLSKSSYKITSFIDFSPYADMFVKLKAYIQKLKINLNEQAGKAGRYPPYYRENGHIQNDIDRKRQVEIEKMLQDAIIEINYLQVTLVKIESTYNKIVNPDKIENLNDTPPVNKSQRKKRSVVGSIFKWLFGGGDNGAEVTQQLKNNIVTLKQNQNLQQDQVKQLLKMNQLTAVETSRNRKLLKDLTKDMIQINFTVAQLEYQSQQLHASVNFLNFMMSVRHKIAVIRDSTFAIQQNLNHLYIYLNTLSTHKLIPKMLTPYDLLALLKTVVRDLRSHPKLKLPVEPTKNEIYQYYQIMSASAVIYDEMLLCILHVPLVDRSKTFQVFKIHNLPLPLPPLNKQMRHKLDHQYLAISTDKLYVTFSTVEEIFSCRMSIGSFCEINNAIYPTSTINSCEYTLFMEQQTLVRKLCKVDLVNFTRDQAFSLDLQFWAILTVQPITMQVSCLTKMYYVKLQHPLNIIFLEESCEASTVSMLLPSHTVLSKEVDSSQLGIRLDQLKLHYQKIQDFTIISNTPIEKLTPQQLESKASYIPKMENISLDKFNTTMTKINKEYPWQMPVWLKIILTIGITIFIIGAMIGCYVCRVRGVRLGWCLSK